MKQPKEGELVTPKIRLVRPLGAGGMGSVWLADHLALHTQVVVKFIAAELADHKEALARFEREAAAASQVKSPHVVQILDHGVTDEGTPFIVMELLEGRDLAAHLEKYGRMTAAEVAEVVVQLCRALSRAHERGIVHRDIKPQNIFLCDAGSGELFVKLLDFGIAKGASVEKLDQNTKTGTVVGSPYYMSPEQLIGAKDIDHRTDLWSVGVVAFEALTGTRAFDAETVGALALRIHNDPLPMPCSRNGHLPPSVDEWFSRACSREVSGRFSSAKEMADAFTAAAGGQSAKSAHSSSTNPLLHSKSDTIALAKTAVDSGPISVSSSSGVTPDPRVLTMSGLSSGARPRARGRLAFAAVGLVAVVAVGVLVVQSLRSPSHESAVATSAAAPPATSPLPNIPPPPPPATTSAVVVAESSAPARAPTPKNSDARTAKHAAAAPSATHAASAPPATTTAIPAAAHTTHAGNEDDIR